VFASVPNLQHLPYIHFNKFYTYLHSQKKFQNCLSMNMLLKVFTDNQLLASCFTNNNICRFNIYMFVQLNKLSIWNNQVWTTCSFNIYMFLQLNKLSIWNNQVWTTCSSENTHLKWSNSPQLTQNLTRYLSILQIYVYRHDGDVCTLCCHRHYILRIKINPYEVHPHVNH
jgi:hypothetical protein